VAKRIEELIQLSYEYDDMKTVRKMKEIVPEFHSLNSPYASLDNVPFTATSDAAATYPSNASPKTTWGDAATYATPVAGTNEAAHDAPPTKTLKSIPYHLSSSYHPQPPTSKRQIKS
jgi:hypothetical protein